MVRSGLAAVALVLAACSAPAPHDLAVNLYQTRSDTPLDKIEMQVRNQTEQPLTVTRAQLRGSRLLASTTWDQPVTIPAGVALDLKVQLPGPTCTDDPADEVEVTYASTAGSRTVVVTPEDPLGQLAKYSSTRCFERDVQDTAELRAKRVRGDALLVYVDPGTARIGRLGTTILFRPHRPEALAARPGDDAGVRRVALTPNRCDAHALGDDKQGTYFPVDVTLADGREGDFTIGVDQRTRQQLYRLYARVCGLS